MSWLWGSSDDEPKKTETEFHKEEISYDNSFVPDKEQNAFGSAFSDSDPYTATSGDAFTTPSDEFFSKQPSASFLPPPDVGGAPVSAGPRVNFDAMGRVNPGTVAPAFGIYGGPGLSGGAGGVEYVFSDDYMEVRRKSFGEQLQYLTGAAFLSGAFGGGGYGAIEGLRASTGKSTKLRLNAVLNGASKRGLAASNGLAVVALMFSMSESGIYHYLSDDGALNYALAGAATGLLYKCTKGVRTAGISGAIGAAISVGTVYMARQGKFGQGLRGLL